MTSARPGHQTAPPTDLHGRRPARHLPSVHPDRVRACLDPRLSAAVAQRLADSERVGWRVAEIILYRHGLNPAMLDDFYGRAAPASSSEADIHPLLHCDLEDCARLAGAAWHARSLKQCVSGKLVADLTALIGHRTRAFGLRNANLAVCSQVVTGAAELAAAINDDGFRCIGALLSSKDWALRGLVHVRLPPGTPAEAVAFGDEHVRHAPAIIERALAELQGTPHA
ncbi:MAG: hypothetical protein J2P50_05490 [Hyphomicrobiaceae bacterium]|nr:hypothetical protein [Hyphomicrobiaceae bacterium]